MKELTQKSIFINEINNKINSGEWGLEEVQHLEENKIKYHLNYEDIGLFLVNVYSYVYSLVLEDGKISELELINLQEFNKLISPSFLPQNKTQRDELKLKINTMVKYLEFNHAVEEKDNIKNKYENNEKIKKEVKKIYYAPFWMKNPKLTPYSSYYD